MVVTSSKMLAQVMREFRYRQGLSQTDLAKQAAIKQATVSAFENMPDSTKLETLFKLLAGLELELVVQPRPKNMPSATQEEWGDVW
ncbi:HTH-type transcriptional regulator/antitoxin HipB [Cricetibacter osteomyelitidis]|uniref:HTH-type transcriptional regulator/antitoxin HipB n=1 Tax=Cricetibacter osteomyelitidis TaxID=1521931 RepID=A0A4R2T3Y5_9PAST|nr:helix-turn-helix domain-containing protein [Cricetibacter osteomyelitidis]TCP95996.1 HTH-type transcriptional regulator/antitoxin HipB [Cricetibacter osteomyelitidis]